MDIIADNQTEATIAKLRRGEATDAVRDEVLAALLTSTQTIVAGLAEMKRSLWSVHELKELVDERHNNLCATCPAKQLASLQAVMKKAKEEEKNEEPAKKESWFAAFLSSESIRYFVLILILVWAVIYIKTGAEGVAAVKSGVTHTVTGGHAQ